MVARLFARFEPLDAYRLDILGSLSGIIAFSLLSFLRTGPLAWGVVIGALFLTLSSRRPDWQRVVSIVLVTGAFGLGALSTLDTWSPYYRVTVGRTSVQGRTEISVPGTITEVASKARLSMSPSTRNTDRIASLRPASKAASFFMGTAPCKDSR